MKNLHPLYHCLLAHRIAALIPAIAQEIEAEDLSQQFTVAHNQFYDAADREEEYWRLQGKYGSISVRFEQRESYLHFYVYTDSETKKQTISGIIESYLRSLQ